MPTPLVSRRLLLGLSALAAVAVMASVLLRPQETRDAATGTLAEQGFVNHGLVGVGRIPADLRDKFGETVGSGSGLAFDPNSWKRTADGYEGVLYLLPDRGYNVEGTVDYRARLNRFTLSFKPVAAGTAPAPAAAQQSVVAALADTILLTDAAGVPATGLDPAEGGIRPAANGFPDLPQAGNGRISLDAEALARLPDGSFLIGDEYGPYVYRFSTDGRMLSAIRPPEAFIPKRKGRDHFSSNNPAAGTPPPDPRNPETGRVNNQGFEGLSLTPDGRTLVVALQSATRQDGGASFEQREHSRMLYYDIGNIDQPKLVREFVMPLPVFNTPDGKRRVAAQSELLALDDARFLLLARDSGNGYGAGGATSLYRKVVLVDTKGATDIAGSKYDGLVPVAPGGKLADGIVPATVRPFIDLNDNAQLGRFGLHNGGPNDRNNLSEKWEGMALVPALDPQRPNDYFLFISNDNDFITQRGHQVGMDYKDASGADVDTMLLVYRVTLPELRK